MVNLFCIIQIHYSGYNENYEIMINLKHFNDFNIYLDFRNAVKVHH